jgi:hypothetical protein
MSVLRFQYTIDLGVAGECDFEIEGRFSPASPPRGPSYSSGGEPGEPAEFELHEIWYIEPGRPRTRVPEWLLERLTAHGGLMEGIEDEAAGLYEDEREAALEDRRDRDRDYEEDRSLPGDEA